MKRFRWIGWASNICSILNRCRHAIFVGIMNKIIVSFAIHTTMDRLELWTFIQPWRRCAIGVKFFCRCNDWIDIFRFLFVRIDKRSRNRTTPQRWMTWILTQVVKNFIGTGRNRASSFRVLIIPVQTDVHFFCLSHSVIPSDLNPYHSTLLLMHFYNFLLQLSLRTKLIRFWRILAYLMVWQTSSFTEFCWL